MARILITGKGGFGDMLPLFALAQGLGARGHTVQVAAEAHHADAAGSVNVPLLKLDIPAATIADQKLAVPRARNSGFADFLRVLSPTTLEAEYEQILSAAKDCDIMIGNQLAYAGSLARKKLEKPWVYCAASPLAFPSYNDPPLFPYLHYLQRMTKEFAWTQRIYLDIARQSSKLMMLSSLGLQHKLGIKEDGHPGFEGIYSGNLNLLMASPELLCPQPDWPPHTVITGFTWLEPEFMKSADRSAALLKFLDSGSPPIVFAPGGSRRTHPKSFFTEGIKACQLQGIRAIIVAARKFQAALPRTPGVFVTDYTPYPELFRGAAAVVHSGGIGAIGWTLRCGTPSLIYPACWDHYDNARRALQNGMAMTAHETGYRAANIASALRALLQNHELRDLLQRNKSLFEKEDGATVACNHIETMLKRL